jgi:hypothetical protein
MSSEWKPNVPRPRSANQRLSVSPTVRNAISCQGDRRLLDQRHLERLFAGLELKVAQPRPVEEMHLVDPWD